MVTIHFLKTPFSGALNCSEYDCGESLEAKWGAKVNQLQINQHSYLCLQEETGRIQAADNEKLDNPDIEEKLETLMKS